MDTLDIGKEKGLVPVLRFKEFDGEWEPKKIGDICKIKNGFAFKGEYFADSGKYIVLTPGNFDINGGFRYQGEKEKYYTDFSFSKEFILQKGELVTVMTEQAAGLIGKGLIVPESDLFLHNQRLGLFKFKEPNRPDFLFQYMSTQSLSRKFSKTAAGTKVRHTSTKLIEGIRLSIPTSSEQKKIATFLSTIDKKIQQLTRKKALLEEYKKGLMQQLFSGVLRFTDEEGKDYPDWEEAVMQDVFERVTKKNKENNQNVLTISAQNGLINQRDYFNRSVAAKNVTGYYLLEKGDFAYNKSYSKGYPMGAIKQLELYEKGVVSTLYICFKLRGDNDSAFYKEYLDNGGINSELHKIAQEGARNHGLLNMSVIEFFRDVKIIRPSIKEQMKIGDFLATISLKIELANEELTKTQTFKKGLLQQMFV